MLQIFLLNEQPVINIVFKYCNCHNSPFLLIRSFWVKILVSSFYRTPWQTRDKCEFDMSYNIYWFSILAINVWIPTIVMFVSYTVIFAKLKQSMKAFPYLSGKRTLKFLTLTEFGEDKDVRAEMTRLRLNRKLGF